MSEFRSPSGGPEPGFERALAPDAAEATITTRPLAHELPTPPAATAARVRRPLLREALRIIALALIAIVATLTAVIVLYRWIDPPFTTLTLAQRAAGGAVDQRWVPLERISPHLVRAVIMSEDAGFCRHYGVDWRELAAAYEQSLEGGVRGGSTISMQVAKNLFLWPSRSYVRKAIEIPLTLVMEFAWPKRRMIEVYLNIAEWGPGIFGAEAAARAHFGKPASRLSEREAALMAVALPSPGTRRPGEPTALTSRMAETVRARIRKADTHFACIPGQRSAS